MPLTLFVCDSVATNVQCDPEGNIQVRLKWKDEKAGRNATTESRLKVEVH